jgi:hypothetical protein
MNRYLGISMMLLTLIGCAPQVHVKAGGSDYTFVWRDLLPDAAPGSELHYKNKKVWDFVYEGYGYSCQGGMMVFTALVPYEDMTGCYSHPQLFVVRGGEPPVVLSQRIMQQPLRVPPGVPAYGVKSLVSTNGGVQVEFQQGTNVIRRDLTWSHFKRFLDEGDSLPKLVHHPFPEYRILP